MNRKTVTAFIARLRRVIARHQERNLAEAFGGEVEVEEFLRGAPSDDKRGRGAPGKVPVFGILERGGKVFAGMIGDTQRETVLPIIKRKVTPDGMVYFEADVLSTMRSDQPGARHRVRPDWSDRIHFAYFNSTNHLFL